MEIRRAEPRRARPGFARPVNCLSCQYRSQRMFCNLGPKALADFARIGTLVVLPTGTVLLHEGAKCDRILVICTGQVMLSCSSFGGKTLNARLAQPGDVLGLGAAISGSCSETTATVWQTTCAKVVGRPDFLGFLERHGEASMHAARLLAEEYRSSFQGVRRIALSGSVAARLASLLLDWGRSSPPGEMVFKMRYTHEDLASFTGTTRETISRTLGAFQKKDLIRIRGDSMQILAEGELTRLAG